MNDPQPLTPWVEQAVRAIILHAELICVLKAHDSYMLDGGYEGPDDTALHPKAAENWRRIIAAIAKAEAQS